MKTLIAIALSLALSGCFYQSVTKHDITDAEKICKKNNAEVVEIWAQFDASEHVLCSNRKSFRLNTENL